MALPFWTVYGVLHGQAPYLGYNLLSRRSSIFDEDLAMERMTVSDAEREFGNLVNRVYSEGISIELEQGDKVVARLTPAGPRSPLKVRDLNAFLQTLPQLGDDAKAFDQDLRDIRRQFPAEANPWD
jgi:antitoxin (DNA-binding transcriptional repressor) of toxin-antitoxin stability system